MWSPHRRTVRNRISVGIFLLLMKYTRTRTQIISCMILFLPLSYYLWSEDMSLLLFSGRKSDLVFFFIDLQKTENSKNLLQGAFSSAIRPKSCISWVNQSKTTICWLNPYLYAHPSTHSSIYPSVHSPTFPAIVYQSIHVTITSIPLTAHTSFISLIGLCHPHPHPHIL